MKSTLSKWTQSSSIISDAVVHDADLSLGHNPAMFGRRGPFVTRDSSMIWYWHFFLSSVFIFRCSLCFWRGKLDVITHQSDGGLMTLIKGTTCLRNTHTSHTSHTSHTHSALHVIISKTLPYVSFLMKPRTRSAYSFFTGDELFPVKVGAIESG